MNTATGETAYRVAFALILFSCLGVSATYRLRARREAGAIPRRNEGTELILGRLLFGLPLAFALLAYPIRPDWLAWSRLDLPGWLRMSGIVMGAALIPALVWMFRSIGNNISETVLTRDEHKLVTHGPYRWVRHPLYTLGSLLILSLGLISASGFILAFAVVIPAGMALVVVPQEEAHLVGAFGDEYRSYMTRTGRFVPKLGRGSGPPT